MTEHAWFNTGRFNHSNASSALMNQQNKILLLGNEPIRGEGKAARGPPHEEMWCTHKTRPLVSSFAGHIPGHTSSGASVGKTFGRSIAPPIMRPGERRLNTRVSHSWGGLSTAREAQLDSAWQPQGKLQKRSSKSRDIKRQRERPATTRYGGGGIWSSSELTWSTEARTMGTDVSCAKGSQSAEHRNGLWTPAPFVQWTCKDFSCASAQTRKAQAGLLPRTPQTSRRTEFVTSNDQTFKLRRPHSFVGKNNQTKPIRATS